MNRRRRAFDWFLGWNDLGLELNAPQTGGCRDGLHADRTNENQGAESMLAFLLSLAEMRLTQGTRDWRSTSRHGSPDRSPMKHHGRTTQHRHFGSGPHVMGWPVLDLVSDQRSKEIAARVLASASKAEVHAAVKLGPRPTFSEVP